MDGLFLRVRLVLSCSHGADKVSWVEWGQRVNRTVSVTGGAVIAAVVCSVSLRHRENVARKTLCEQRSEFEGHSCFEADI